jgi:integrase
VLRQAVVAQARKALGEEQLPVSRLHDLRHHATLLAARGVLVEVVPERLGHASAITTEEDAVLPRGLLRRGAAVVQPLVSGR